MTIEPRTRPLFENELDVLAELVPIASRDIVELGCGAAALAHSLLDRYPGSQVTGLEVDERQHAKNLASHRAGLHFIAAGAQDIPLPDGSLRARGWLYVSEPVYDGPQNEVIRLFNDEGVVRAAAQAAGDAALLAGTGEPVAQRFFEMPVSFKDFTDSRTSHGRCMSAFCAGGFEGSRSAGIPFGAASSCCC